MTNVVRSQHHRLLPLRLRTTFSSGGRASAAPERTEPRDDAEGSDPLRHDDICLLSPETQPATAAVAVDTLTPLLCAVVRQDRLADALPQAAGAEALPLLRAVVPQARLMDALSLAAGVQPPSAPWSHTRVAHVCRVVGFRPTQSRLPFLVLTGRRGVKYATSPMLGGVGADGRGGWVGVGGGRGRGRENTRTGDVPRQRRRSLTQSILLDLSSFYIPYISLFTFFYGCSC